MAKREAINITVILILGILILLIVVYISLNLKPVQGPYPWEDKEKIRFVKYLTCAMAMCSGEAKQTSSCSKDICASPEVQGIGPIDEDENGNEITCADFCRNITNDCYERFCGEEHSIEFTVREIMSISQEDIFKIGNPFGRAMHWCCDYREEGWHLSYPIYYDRGTGGKLYIPYQISKQYCSLTSCISLSRSECEKNKNCYWCGCGYFIDSSLTCLPDEPIDECSGSWWSGGKEKIYHEYRWVGCKNIPSQYSTCTFEKGTKITFYAFPDENIYSFWILGAELCTVDIAANEHVCSSIKITKVQS
ncbi:MAG: hypothetical protein QXP77_00040 [Candidatus Aenigmatarchaeota archaeon]